ncbi:MAG: universal stress protein [Bacteroidota bacterium]
MTFAPRNILVPTDFSAPAEIALEYAKDIARTHKSVIYIIHCLEPNVYSGDMTGAMADIGGAHQYLLEFSGNELKKKAISLESEGFEVRIRTLDGGNPADEIVEYADANGIDLICIATHGRNGWARFMLGSIAERVLRKAMCAVLTVRRKGDE